MVRLVAASGSSVRPSQSLGSGQLGSSPPRSKKIPSWSMLYFDIMKSHIVERTGKIEELDRSFDLNFWQAQSDTDRFAAAWELVVHSYIIKGKDARKLRLQRSVENFQRLPS